MIENYYLGLDVGTNSVGAACAYPDYRLVRLKGRDAWAVRLFDEATVAVERRMKRTARRRLRRRVWRLQLLRELFAPHIDDKLFFPRLDNSPYALGDKDAAIKSGYVLFADPDYTDKQYHKQFPTIYHLRLALMQGGKKYDLRLYYLAIHHIIKYRGNFLHEGRTFGTTNDLSDLIVRLNEEIERTDNGDTLFSLDPGKALRFEEAYMEADGITARKKAAIELFGASDRRGKAIVSAAVGATVTLADLFDDDAFAKSQKLALPGIDDVRLGELRSKLDDKFGLIESIKGIYDYFVLKTILKGSSSISEAMVGLYDKFHADLVRLKRFVRANYEPETYKRIFKSIGASDGDKNNFVHYIGYSKPEKRKIKVAKCSAEEFFADLRKTLEKEFIGTDTAERDAILNEIREERFLKKILHADNGVVPYQINGTELEKIVANLVADYPLFGIKDEDGLSPAEKIVSIFEFRIPYYVGPLNPYGGSKNAWVVRLERGAVTPWNFDAKVDRAGSGEEFIRRMTRTCTYLVGEPVLPASSPLYEKFNTLNIINKLTLHNRPIDVALKKRLFDELYSVDPHVTDKKIRDFLLANGCIERAEATADLLGGRDAEASHPTLATYIRLKEILGSLVDERPEIAEDIVLWHTLHTDKSIVEGLIRKRYGNVPAVRDNIGRLKGLNVSGFGRLSKKFLAEVFAVDHETGAMRSIVDLLYDTNKNLNELLGDDEYGLKARIEEMNGEESGEVEYEDVEKLPLSPAVRRGVWQALNMVKEYIAAAGRAPSKIFIEVTRAHEQEKKRTESRKDKLRRLLGSPEDRELLAELEGVDDMRLREEKLYLYFLQLGRCAYSGERIELDRLGSDSYDIDHIVPQSLVKDDGFENKVLVKRALNAAKSDTYPLPSGLATSEAKLNWKIWRDKDLMGAKKYNALMRRTPLTQDDLNGFIARQIVETGQTAKAVAELLHRMCPESRIVYSKGSNVSEFRDRYGLVKCREVNDLHHAQDAYLNIVVGNVYDVSFSSVSSFYRTRPDGETRRYNLEHLFDRDISGAWEKNVSLGRVKETCRRTTMAVTRYTFVDDGKFYKETVFPKGDKGIGAPRKTHGPLVDVNKYGGYKTIYTAYFAVVESMGKKGKLLRTIEAIPVIVDHKTHGDENMLLEYLKQKGLVSPRFIVPKLRTKTLMKINGMPLYIAGITGNNVIYHNAVQWHTDIQTERYVKALGKLLDMNKNGMLRGDEEYYDMWVNRTGKVSLRIDREHNVALYDAIVAKLGDKLYGVRPAITFRNNLISAREKFISLPTLQQSQTLMECVKFMQCNALTVDLSNVGGGAGCGKLKLDKDITDLDVVIVHMSACGLDVRERKLR